MTVYDAHTATIALQGATLNADSARVTVDESWSPFVQVNVECGLPDDLESMVAVDPRDADRVTLTLRRDYGEVWANSVFTAAHPTPTTNATLTAAYGGLTNGAITSLFFRSWNAFGVRDSDTRVFDVTVRRRTIDHLSKKVTLELASDEALLQDYALIATTKYVNVQTSLRGLVAYVLGLVGATLQPGSDDASITAGALEWAPGQSAWDFLRTPVETAALRLWCDEARHWWLTARAPLSAGSLTLTTGENGTLKSAVDSIDRDGDWHDAVVITYQWTDALGAQQRAYDVAGDALTATKVYSVTRDQKYPGAGAAAQMLKQSAGRGRVLDLTAVADYRAAPGQAFTAQLPDTPIQTGVVSAVTWQLPSAEMTVRTRGLTDTPTTAWIFDPPGLSWSSIPVGIDWTEDI